jgi:RNA polymerase sigma-70 factor, ECF subfamily
MPDWPEMVREYGPLVWNAVGRLLRNQADARDCFQETFLRAIKYGRERQVDNWPGLLWRIATQAALDHRRKRNRSVCRRSDCIDPSVLPASDTEPSDRLASAELAERLRNAVTQLPEQQAEVFVLRHFHELSYEQIAELMGISATSAGVLLHRARTRLAEVLNVNLSSKRG